MRKNTFAKYRYEVNSIFKDESVFYPEYLPENITSRDSEIKELSYYLSPISKNKKATNFLIYGPPGTGKTLISKYVTKELCEYTNRAKVVYVNLIQYNSRFSVLSRLATFFEIPLPRRGLAIDEVFDRIKFEFSKVDFWPIIILDEIDKMPVDDASKLLYDLSRIESKGRYFILILITNYKSFLLTLDNRTQSSLFLNELEFKKYSSLDLKQILKERIDYGLIPNSISKDLVGFIAGYATKRGGDARIAIDLLYKGAKESEKEGKLKIEKQILIKSARLVDSIKLSEKVNYISKEEYSLLCLIEDGMPISKLYKLSKSSERTVRRYLSNLEKIGLITLNKINIGKGKSRKIYLNFDSKLLLL